MNRKVKRRQFWEGAYNKFAWLYDAIDWFTFNTAQKYRSAILDYLPESGKRLLEIGVGTGKLQRLLAKDYQLTGFDLAAGMLRLTRKRLLEAQLTSFLCQGNAYALPWADSTFDAVVLSFVFSAIPDGQSAFNEMLRVLRPNGRIIILDAGEAENGNQFAHILALMWELIGDFIRDERQYMAPAGMKITRRELGPGGCVHIVVGENPN